jgi:dienelactone hydrolase
VRTGRRLRAVAVLALLAVPAPLAAAARLVADPAVGLADEAVRIRVEGAPPGREVRLRASATDADGGSWRSEAVFRADRRGRIDVATASPTEGTYSGVAPMGLLWSMRREAPPAAAAARAPIQDLLIPPDGPMFPHRPQGAVEVTVEAMAEGRAIASTVLKRQWTLPEVRVTEVREGPLVGRLFEPPGGPHPALLLLAGSNGGTLNTHAALLAAHGYVTFTLAYFRAPGLPDDLLEIPLEYLKQGIDWLRARPSVDGDRVGVLGASRGAELALLLAATYPELKAAVAISPSDRVWEAAVRSAGKTGIEALKADRTSWTLEGKPLSFMPKTLSADLVARLQSGGRFAGREMMDVRGADPATAARAAIPVERIAGPILLVSGGADRMWPSVEMAATIEKRLSAARFPHRVVSLVYPGAGHVFADSWMPVPYGGSMGGTAEANARAFADYWPKLQAFLRASLGPPAAK